MLLEVYHKYLKQSHTKKAPGWTRELKEMIQDQLDTNMSLSLQQVSHDLEINPSYYRANSPNTLRTFLL